MTLLFASFVAGALTILSPCVLPLLPVIIGGAVIDQRSRWKPYVITLSLAISVIVFTLLLKFATVFVDVPEYVWQWISGSIITVFGLSMVLPDQWERFTAKANLTIMRRSNALLAIGVKRESLWGDVIIGAALGPVFSSCSPTYFVILATVLPVSFAMGLIDLVAYAIGLSIMLLAVALFGQRLVGKLRGVSDPRGWFKRILGIVFFVAGVFVLMGWSRAIETYLINKFDVTKLENIILKNFTRPSSDLGDTIEQDETGGVYPRYREITDPAGFVNTGEFKLADMVGKKVILLDFMTYSCINCQRTFPYLRAWYDKYKDAGLEIVAIHTPEFAFEKKRENVIAAFKQFGLTFPAVLDNDYGTWNAWGNNYWPHKYLIDIDGSVRYDHIGEGAYEETEEMIKTLLKERAKKLGSDTDILGSVSKDVPKNAVEASSAETYFGAYRNSTFFGNGTGGMVYEKDFTLPDKLSAGYFYLGGKWIIDQQYIESEGESILAFPYNTKTVYLVAESQNGGRVQVQNKVKGQENIVNVSSIDIGLATLYTVIGNKERESGTMLIKADKGVRLYSLTFG